MQANELKFAPEKIEALIITKKRKREGLSFKIYNAKITPRKTIKYLGIFFDTGGSFREHEIKVVEKAEDKKTNKLTRLMPNIGRSTSSKRAVLVRVVHPIQLYRALVWASALKVQTHWLLLQMVQRKILIRVTAAHRTASTISH